MEFVAARFIAVIGSGLPWDFSTWALLLEQVRADGGRCGGCCLPAGSAGFGAAVATTIEEEAARSQICHQKNNEQGAVDLEDGPIFACCP
ncbi:hypothetical protein ACLOJK_034663 [Asimina triloba]